MTKYKNRVLTYSVIEIKRSFSKQKLFEFYDGVKNLGIKFNNETTTFLAELEISPIIDICREFSYNYKERFTKKEFEESYVWKDKDWGALKNILASNIEKDKLLHYEMSYEVSFFRDKPFYNPGFENWEYRDFLDYERDDRSFMDKFYSLDSPFWEHIYSGKHHKFKGVPEWGEDYPKWKKWLKNNGYDEKAQADALIMGAHAAIFALRDDEDLPTDSEIEAIELTDEDINEWKEHKEKQNQKELEKRAERYKKNLDTWN